MEYKEALLSMSVNAKTKTIAFSTWSVLNTLRAGLRYIRTWLNG